jgi:hypothetical protein
MWCKQCATPATSFSKKKKRCHSGNFSGSNGYDIVDGRVALLSRLLLFVDTNTMSVIDFECVGYVPDD